MGTTPSSGIPTPRATYPLIIRRYEPDPERCVRALARLLGLSLNPVAAGTAPVALAAVVLPKAHSILQRRARAVGAPRRKPSRHAPDPVTSAKYTDGTVGKGQDSSATTLSHPPDSAAPVPPPRSTGAQITDAVDMIIADSISTGEGSDHA
jgi:hypothetical protein